MQHREGWPVSYGSYVRGCRCAGCAAKKREYYERNRDEIAAKRREYYERNRDEIAAKRREYRERNPWMAEYFRIAADRRRRGLDNRGLADALRTGAPLDDTPSRDTDVEIQQAIARGLTTTQIMQTLGVDYAAVRSVRERLDEAS